ncbi:hypothetical protein KOW79_001335 [Hemibagrus wyckioides]|uniref:Uncharacterized protein n=1 Tax=Hemibagrus wyckioides TaxID=337641 RepID=A0A9D3P728_9TELE|nr:hypothetical protein KOW79_001335 [Hemibagrus wyckioides]
MCMYRELFLLPNTRAASFSGRLPSGLYNNLQEDLISSSGQTKALLATLSTEALLLATTLRHRRLLREQSTNSSKTPPSLSNNHSSSPSSSSSSASTPSPVTTSSPHNPNLLIGDSTEDKN